jgi:predicted negative regulator of RcsB-dependent stress response
MEEYASEQEQVDELKKLVKENAPWALGGIVLGGLIYFGYTQYQGWLDQKAHTGAAKYELVIAALAKQDRGEAQKQLTQLQTDYARSPFADQAALALARFEVDKNDFDAAKQHLASVVDNSKDPALQEVAILRLARVERALGQRAQALALLDKAKGGRDDAVIWEVKGDLYADAGDIKAAQEAYGKALSGAKDGMVNKELIELKLNALNGHVSAEKKP